MTTETTETQPQPDHERPSRGPIGDAAAKAAKAAAEHRRRFAEWTPDPWVVVAKRPYVLFFPPALLRGDTPAWRVDPTHKHDPVGRPVEEFGTLRLGIGLNFLAARTTCARYVDLPVPGPAPQAAPAEGDMRLVTLASTLRTMIETQFGDRVAPESKALDAPGLLAAWRRVFDWLRHAPDGETHRGTSPDLFAARTAHEAPDVYLTTFSALMRSATPADAVARATAENNVKWGKHEPTLGAAHDYAVRAGAVGTSLAQECRVRLRFFQTNSR